jgi:hypothetical protein
VILRASMDWTRRRTLQVGLLGSLALLVGTIGISLRRTVLRAPARPLKVLTAEQYSVLFAVAERFHPGKQPHVPSASRLGVAEDVDELLARAHPGFVSDFGRALLFFENATTRLLFEGSPTTFTSCAPEVQDRILEAWRGARSHLRRQVFHAMLGLCSAAYWGNPLTWPAMDYAGPPPLPRRP